MKLPSLVPPIRVGDNATFQIDDRRIKPRPLSSQRASPISTQPIRLFNGSQIIRPAVVSQLTGDVGGRTLGMRLALTDFVGALRFDMAVNVEAGDGRSQHGNEHYCRENARPDKQAAR